MLHILKRHPIPICAEFDHCFVLTYAFDSEHLQPLLPPGLELDTYKNFGFVAIALVQTRKLRPAFAPRWLGRDFFLAGYRIFATHRGNDGRTRRGLRILRSDTNKRTMMLFGNALTHYNYRLADARLDSTPRELHVNVSTPDGVGDLRVTADLENESDTPPEGSPFPDLKTARRFAGPLPWTFDYEKQTHSIVRIKGVRADWTPTPVNVHVERVGFFDQDGFRDAPRQLANAFYLRGVPYRWERGIREPLERADA